MITVMWSTVNGRSLRSNVSDVNDDQYPTIPVDELDGTTWKAKIWYGAARRNGDPDPFNDESTMEISGGEISWKGGSYAIEKLPAYVMTSDNEEIEFKIYPNGHLSVDFFYAERATIIYERQNATSTLHANVSDANDNIDQFNKFISTQIGTITEALQNIIPASYGDCGSDSPPQPCQDKGSDLFYKHKSWAYKATARWIAGLKTIAFDSIKVGADADGNLNSVVGAGHFDKLPVSIHIDECFTFDKCSTMWDNSDACCGSDKHFAVTIDVKCDPSTKRLEYLNLGKLDLDDFKITESLGKVSLPSYDITSSVHDAASGVLGDYLSEAFIPYNGTKVTIVDYLNENGGDFLNSLC